MDRYDKHIAKLTKNPDSISDDWGNGKDLFKFIGISLSDSPYIAGCLSMIRGDREYGAFLKGKFDKKLTNEIRKDERLPKHRDDITVDHLPVFAEWQRKIDKMRK